MQKRMLQCSSGLAPISGAHASSRDRLAA